MKDYLQNHINLLLGVCGLLIVLLFSSLGYIIFSPAPDREVLCKEEIAQISILERDVSLLVRKGQDDKQRILDKCHVDEREACTQKIARYEEACNKLRCELCNARSR